MPSLEGHPDLFAIGVEKHTFKYRGYNTTRTMLPLIPAYAMSIHKSQGQTLGKVIVNLGSKEFATGLTYTGITRVKAAKDIAFYPVPTEKRLTSAIKRNGFQTVLTDNRTSRERSVVQ